MARSLVASFAALALMVGLSAASAAGAHAADGPRNAPAGTVGSVLSQPVQHVTVNGASLGYRVAGSGRPLVLISGSSNTMAEWDPVLLDRLARDRKVIVFDNRGVGTSTGALQHLTIGLMARDTRGLIRRVAGGRADVLGWSMGGYIAQALTIRWPKTVRRLVLASTDCGGPDVIPPTKRALAVLTDPNATTAQFVSILFPRDQQAAGTAWLGRVSEAYAANSFQPSNAFTVSPQAVAAQTKAAGSKWTRGGTCTRLHRIHQRVLVGVGADDIVVRPRNRHQLMAGLRCARVRVYRDAGHAFLFQPSLGFTGAVGRFL